MRHLEPLIAKLQAWSLAGGDFHGDRQLADEVLIADGWRVEKDDGFEGGFCWSWGTSPRVCSSESTRPHVINDLNTAIGVVPFGCNWRLMVFNGTAIANVWAHGDAFHDEFKGCSERPSVALLIAALKYKQAIVLADEH